MKASIAAHVVMLYLHSLNFIAAVASMYVQATTLEINYGFKIKKVMKLKSIDLYIKVECAKLYRLPRLNPNAM